MIFEKVKEIISKEIKIESSKINLDSKLNDDLGLDSLDAVEIIMSVEDEYDIQIDDEAAQNFKTIADLINYIEDALK